MYIKRNKTGNRTINTVDKGNGRNGPYLCRGARAATTTIIETDCRDVKRPADQRPRPPPRDRSVSGQLIPTLAAAAAATDRTADRTDYTILFHALWRRTIVGYGGAISICGETK